MHRPLAPGKYDLNVVKHWNDMYISEKYDGWRLLWFPVEGIFRTRSGKVLTLSPSFYQEAKVLSPNYVLDGELWAVNNTKELKFMVFDIIIDNKPFSFRYNVLQKLFKETKTNYLTLVEHKYYMIPKSIKVLDKIINSELEAVINHHGEGIVLRSGDSLYCSGPSKDCLKFKPIETSEVIVVGYHQTYTAHVNILTHDPNYVSSLICYTADQLDLKVSIKSNNPPPIGSIIEIRHSDWTVSGLPKFPVIVKIRPDDTIEPDLLAKFQSIRDNLNIKVDQNMVDYTNYNSTNKVKKSYSLSDTQILLLEKNKNYLSTYLFEDLVEMKKHNNHSYAIKLNPGQFVLVKSGTNIYKLTKPMNGAPVYCTCPSWIYQKLPVIQRTCKHCQLFI